MSQSDRHLTNEELSCYLDDVFSIEEETLWQAHLHTCSDCQAHLNDLRQVSRILHTLPQPILPHAFKLPEDIQLIQFEHDFELIPPTLNALPTSTEVEKERGNTDKMPLVLLEEEEQIVAQEPELLPIPRRRNWRPDTFFQVISGLAALIAVFLTLSSILPSLHIASTSGVADSGQSASVSSVESSTPYNMGPTPVATPNTAFGTNLSPDTLNQERAACTTLTGCGVQNWLTGPVGIALVLAILICIVSFALMRWFRRRAEHGS